MENDLKTNKTEGLRKRFYSFLIFAALIILLDRIFDFLVPSWHRPFLDSVIWGLTGAVALIFVFPLLEKAWDNLGRRTRS
jgi:hypothetical protein